MTGSIRAKARRGWAVTAALRPDLMRAIAAKGGAAMPHAARSFSRDPAMAAEAGRKGGSAPRVKPKPLLVVQPEPVAKPKPRGRSQIEFEGQELADYRNARNQGFTAAEARGIVVRSRR